MQSRLFVYLEVDLFTSRLTWSTCSGLMIGLLKQKSSVFMIRSLENQFLLFIVFHCYNQPITKSVGIGWWLVA